LIPFIRLQKKPLEIRRGIPRLQAARYTSGDNITAPSRAIPPVAEPAPVMDESNAAIAIGIRAFHEHFPPVIFAIRQILSSREAPRVAVDQARLSITEVTFLEDPTTHRAALIRAGETIIDENEPSSAVTGRKSQVGAHSHLLSCVVACSCVELHVRDNGGTLPKPRPLSRAQIKL
jgi:hypothetical protein